MKAQRTPQERVEFFSKHDGAWPFMLQNAERLINNPPKPEEMDLNLLLEFHHIKQYFEHDLYLPKWSEETRSEYRATTDQYIAQARKYFLAYQQDILKNDIATLEFGNRKSFWHLFSYFESYKKFERTIILDILRSEPNHLRYILQVKTLVQHYNNELRTSLLVDGQSAELLLSQFEEKQDRDRDELYFPKSLNDADKQQIITGYLEGEDPNPNYVDLILKSRNLKLGPKILLKAKQSKKAFKENFFMEEQGMVHNFEGGMKKSQTEPVIYEHTEDSTIITYGGTFFESLKSDTELFSTLSDVFLYMNEEELIDLVNKESEVDDFERTFMQSKNEYFAGITFQKKDLVSSMQLQIFDGYLRTKGRSIENLLEGFVQDFFRENQGVENLEFKLPPADAAPGDKIRMLAPELEYLLKQYKHYVTDGEIDHELLQMESAPGYLSDIPSLVKEKYISSDHPRIKMVEYNFFKPYSMMGRVEGKNSGKSLYKILRFEKLIFTRLEGYQQDYVRELEKEGLLSIEEDQVKVANPGLVHIAGLLRKNLSINYWRHADFVRSKIDQLVQEGLLKTSSQLFTIDECHYINYYLNKKDFSNGYDLRNMYMHGTNRRTEAEQRSDYRKFMRIVILILLRLKEDMELAAALR